MNLWFRLGRAVTWLTVAVCAATPTLAVVGLLTWLITMAGDDVMLRLTAAVRLPFVLVLGVVMLALGPWWALAWALLMRDRATAKVTGG